MRKKTQADLNGTPGSETASNRPTMLARVALRAALLAALGLGVCSAQAQRVDTLPADLIKPGSVIIETEDFNYTDDTGAPGKYLDGNQMVGGEYQLLTATKGIDYNDGNSDGDKKRPDVTVAMVSHESDNDRGLYVVSHGFKAGWNDSGDWRNYTRKYPDVATVYDVYGRFSSGGSDNALDLSLVVAGADTDTQKVVKLGSLKGPASGGWDTFVFTGFSSDGGATKGKVALKGEQTLRITTTGGNNDQNYLVLVPDPATTSVPTVTSIVPSPGELPSTTDPTAVSATFLEQSFTIADASIGVKLDGATIPSTVTRTGSLIEVAASVGPFTGFDKHTIVISYTENGAPKTLTTFLSAPGSILHRYYDGLADSEDNITGLQVGPRFLTGDADTSSLFPSIENDGGSNNSGRSERGDHFGSHFIGFLTPEASGSYNFYVASDDQSILWLSTDADPANKVKLAEQTSWSNSREFVTSSNGGDEIAKRKSAAINLTAGTKYYIEYLQFEGGGGDNGAVTWTKDGAAAKDGQAPLATGLTPWVGTAFDKNPLSQTIAKGRSVSFSAHAISDKWIALGTPAISYQWFKGATPIDGATGATYTIDAVTLADNDAVFTVQVSDTQGAKPLLATSKPATLTVQDDVTPAKIVAVEFESPRSAIIKFDEEVSNPGAAVFTADSGLVIDSTSGSGKGWAVHFASSVPANASVTITATGFTDLAGNTAPTSGSGKLLFTAGLLKHEHYSGNSGGNNIDTTVYANAIFPNSPTYTKFLSQVDIPQTANPNEDNFTDRITAFITPAVSGNYYFFTRSDDSSRINLSTDDDPANKVDIADETGCCNGFYEPDAGDASTSAAIALEAGKKYYIEMLVQEGGGGDFIQVASRKDDGSIGAFPLLGSNQDVIATSVILDPASVSLAIGSNPADAAVTAGNTASFNASATTTPSGIPVTWQWQVKAVGAADFSDIAGATGNSFTSRRLGLSDSGIQYRAIAKALGSIVANTTAATATVTAGAPAGVSAIGSLKNEVAGKSVVGVTFDSPVLAATAVNPANYTVSGAVVESVRYLDKGNSAVLTLASVIAPGANYTVTVAGVTDFAGNTVAGSWSAKGGKMSFAGIGANEVPANIPDAVPVGADGFDVYNGGVGFWADYDETTFVFEKISGDFDREVRVAYQEPSSQWARGGLVVRHDLDDIGKARPTVDNGLQFSTYVSFHVNPTTMEVGGGANNSHEINHRVLLGGATTGTGPSPNTAPAYPNAWLRIKRITVADADGEPRLEFYRRSAADADWIKVASKNLADWDPSLDGDVYVGPNLGAEVGNNGASRTHGNYLIQFRDYGCGPDDDSCGGVVVPPPTLSASLVAGKLHIVFANGTLQRSDKVGPGAVWTDVGTSSPVDVTDGYYRVKQ